MILSSLIQYQPRTCTSFKNLMAYCTQSQISKRIILAEEKQSKIFQHNLDVYDYNLMELRFLIFKDEVVLNLLTETAIKGYSLNGKVKYTVERQVEGDIAQFDDKFVSSAVVNNTLYTLSQRGSVYILKDKKIQPVHQIQGRGIAISSVNNTLIISTEQKKLWKIQNNILSELVKVETKLPVYYIQVLQDESVVLGTISGELLIGRFEKNGFEIICKLQAHIGLLTYLIAFEDVVISGSDDGYVNYFKFSKGKLSLVRSRNFGRIITGIFKLNQKMYCSVYQSFELIQM